MKSLVILISLLSLSTFAEFNRTWIGEAIVKTTECAPKYPSNFEGTVVQDLNIIIKDGLFKITDCVYFNDAKIFMPVCTEDEYKVINNEQLYTMDNMKTALWQSGYYRDNYISVNDPGFGYYFHIVHDENKNVTFIRSDHFQTCTFERKAESLLLIN